MTKAGTMAKDYDYAVHLPKPHGKQQTFIRSDAKRKIIRAGRRGGKTVGVAIYAVEKFLEGKRVLYATPTADQIARFWFTVTNALQEPIAAKVLYKNETMHVVELAGTEQRIRAKTAWNADTLRGDYADELILDEWQLMDEDTWELVGAPMLLDNDGNATFIYTPPSLHSRSVSKARDPQHAAKMYKKYKAEMEAGNTRYLATHFTSHDNPYISKTALSELTHDMTALAIRMEIQAEDVDEAPGALWTREIIEKNRVLMAPPLQRVVVAIDPTNTATGDEAGIITAGAAKGEMYTLADDSLQGSPKIWAQAAIVAYHKHRANYIVAEVNNGGEMVVEVIHSVDKTVPVKMVTASRGKATRAEPISAQYEEGRGHHVGSFPALEDEMCLWIPGDDSPNRMDALVWAGTELLLHGGGPLSEKNQPTQKSKFMSEPVEDEGSRWRRY